MLLNFFPKEVDFCKLFGQQADCAIRAAELFVELMAKGIYDDEAVKNMRDLEHQGDDVAHLIIESLNKTFITPFDREDIFALAKELDSVTDMIFTIVNRLHVYRVIGPKTEMQEFAMVIERSTRALGEAVRGLLDPKKQRKVLESCIEVNSLENVGDMMRDRMLEKLFAEEKDPIQLIIWKELYQYGEITLDICEDVAHVIESILVKQS